MLAVASDLNASIGQIYHLTGRQSGLPARTTALRRRRFSETNRAPRWNLTQIYRRQCRWNDTVHDIRTGIIQAELPIELNFYTNHES